MSAEWHCTSCGAVNATTAPRCASCDGERPVPRGAGQTAEQYTCAKCGIAGWWHPARESRPGDMMPVWVRPSDGSPDRIAGWYHPHCRPVLSEVAREVERMAMQSHDPLISASRHMRGATAEDVTDLCAALKSRIRATMKTLPYDPSVRTAEP